MTHGWTDTDNVFSAVRRDVFFFPKAMFSKCFLFKEMIGNEHFPLRGLVLFTVFEIHFLGE